MANLLGLIFVVFLIGFGVMACYGIVANGASQTPTVDSFGNQPPAPSVAQQAQSSSFATATMVVLPIIFIISICVVIVAAIVWFYKTGSRKNKNGY